jgi:hypothetical protein
MTNVFTLKSAQEAGKVSKRNSKMPGTSFAISAKRCNVGSRLANVKGSTCNKCYALKLQKLRPSVDKGWELNYTKATTMIDTDMDRWVKSMTFQILRSGEEYHRWFDSGDLSSVAMLRAIVMVAQSTPNVKHWLPTREVQIVRDYAAKYAHDTDNIFPPNLVVRVSAPMIDQKPLRFPNTSTVHTNDDYVGHECPASTQGNNCGDCRACWDGGIPNVSYPLH